jgi:hypothetical protein
LDLN